MLRRLSVLFLIFLWIGGCSKKGDPDPQPLSRSQRQIVLNSIGNQLITGGFVDFQTSVNNLRYQVEQFKKDLVSHQKLNDVKGAWLQCAVAWKRVSLFTFGPVDESFVTAGIYGLPDTDGIETLITGSLDPIDSIYVRGLGPGYQGLQAVEYLLYGRGDNQATINLFTREGSNGRRLAYLEALGAVLQAYADQALMGWSRGGENYVAAFIAADGSGQDASLGKIVYKMVDLVALMRKERLGRPKGIYDNGIPQPGAVDGKYSNKSLELFRAELEALAAAFTGVRDSHSSSVGSASGILMLLEIVAKESDSESVAPLITAQLSTIYSQSMSINEPLKDALVSQPQQVDELYKAVEKLETLMLEEMMQALHYKN